MKTQFILLFALLIGIVSCKKGSSDPNPDLSSTLTSHSWVHNGYSAIIDGQTYIGKNAYGNYMGPDPSIIFTFKSDGTFLITETNTSNAGKWTLSGTTLDMTNTSGDKYIFTLSNASTSNLTMSFSEVSGTGLSDLALIEWPLAYAIKQSNGLDVSTFNPKKIQVQYNLTSK